MRLFSKLAVTLAFVSSWACLGQTTPTAEKLTYEAMVQNVKGGDKSIDFRALRLAYVDSETQKNAKDTDSQKKAMKAAVQKKEFDETIAKADEVLRENFVDMDAHFAKYIAYREQGKADQAAVEKFILGGLLQSITDSGDGKTPETAFQVIEVHEEYVVLQFSGLMPAGQALVHKNGHSYDQMKAVNPKTNEKVTLYFNVDIPFARYSK